MLIFAIRKALEFVNRRENHLKDKRYSKDCYPYWKQGYIVWIKGERRCAQRFRLGYPYPFGQRKT